MRFLHLYLICAVWLAITGAAYVNQLLLAGSAPSAFFRAFSLTLWGIHAVAAAALFYALLPRGASERGASRLARTVRLWSPLVVSCWCLVAAICHQGMDARVFTPFLLLSTAFVMLWWGRGSVALWSAVALASLSAFGAALFPRMAALAVGGMCVVYFLFALFSRIRPGEGE